MVTYLLDFLMFPLLLELLVTGVDSGWGSFWGTPKLHKEGKKRCACADKKAVF